MNIKGIVTKLIKKHKTNDPFKIAEKENIVILYEELGRTLGYYSYHNRFKYIHLNNKLDERIVRFVCAHELGHAKLHPKSNTPFLRYNTFFSIEKIEIEANTFAVELLLSDDFLKEYENTTLTIYDAANIHGIPEKLVALKKFNHKTEHTFL